MDRTTDKLRPAIFLRNIAPLPAEPPKENSEAVGAGAALLEAMTTAYEKRLSESWEHCGLEGMSAFIIERIDYIAGEQENIYKHIELHGESGSGQECKIIIEANGGGFTVIGAIDTQKGGNA